MDRSDTERYRLLVVNGDLKAFDVFTGAELPIYFPQGKAYLAGSDFRAVTVGDSVVLLNRAVTALRDGTLKSAVRAPEALLYVRQADYETVYTVTLNGVTVSTKTVSSDAIQARTALNTDSIAEGIQAALNAQASLSGFTVTRYGSTVYLTRADGADFTLTVSDGLASKGLVGIKGTVQRAEDLPTEGPSGIIVEVVGDPESTADNYFVTFDGHVWRECVKPGVLTDFDASTLPHLIEYQGDIYQSTGQGKPSLPTIGEGGTTEERFAWESNIGATVFYDGSPHVTSAHDSGFSYAPGTFDGTLRTVRVTYDVQPSPVDDGANTVEIQLWVGGVERDSKAYTVVTGSKIGETLEWTGSPAGGDAVVLKMHYLGGATPADPAYLTGLGNTDGGPILVLRDLSAKLTFDPAYKYPAGLTLTVTLNGTPFAYPVGASDQTGAQVATGIAALVDADAGFISTSPSSGVTLLRTSGGAVPTTLVASDFNNLTTFHSPTLALTPGDQVGGTIKNLTDGSSGIVTANTATTVTVVALTGGADNKFTAGDVITLVGNSRYFVFRPADVDFSRSR
jgi:hypothetical protein